MVSRWKYLLGGQHAMRSGGVEIFRLSSSGTCHSLYATQWRPRIQVILSRGSSRPRERDQQESPSTGWLHHVCLFAGEISRRSAANWSAAGHSFIAYSLLIVHGQCVAHAATAAVTAWSF